MAFHYSPKITTDGLILYLDAANSKSYPGSGTTWTDISKNYFDATLSNATFDTARRGSFVLNGTTAYASGPSISPGSFGTVNIWFKQNSALDNKGLFAIGSGAFFYIGAGNDLTIYNGSGPGGYSAPVHITRAYSWNMATYTWAGGSASIYLNADETTSITSSISFSTTGAYYIGVYGTLNPTSYFDGRISNVQVYNRRLSLAEIKQNYLAVKSRYNNNTNDSPLT